jgi:hypothetical protein
MTTAAKAQPTWTVPVPITITAEDVESVIISAYEGGQFGIDYWCKDVHVENPKVSPRKRPEAPSQWFARRLMDGSALVLDEYDDDGDVAQVRLTLDKLLAAFALWAATTRDALTLDGKLDALQLDGPASDWIIQQAVFGEQRYG